MVGIKNIDGQFEVEMVLDSIANGVRLSTLRLRYPRMIHCFDEQTEILCRLDDGSIGFKTFPEAKKLNAEVAAVGFDLSVDFEQPSEWIESHHEGRMIEFSNQRLNFCVTENHRLFVGSRKSWGDEKEIITASELMDDHTQKRFYKSGILKERKSIGGPEFAKLLGFFIGDGHLPKAGHWATFRFKKQRKIDAIVHLLTELSLECKIKKYADGVTTIYLKKQEWMYECYGVDGRKRIPAFAMMMLPEEFQEFKKGMIESDGSIDAKFGEWFNTFSGRLIDDFQALCHLNGVSFNKKLYGEECFKVRILKEDTPILRKDKHRPSYVENYSGKVYCCTVSTGLLMVRRNGIVHISGNSEFMTHRVFSRNASSSRAIPLKRTLREVWNDPAIPIHWGANQRGMQANGELKGFRLWASKKVWRLASKFACIFAWCFDKVGLHKQVGNRILEPFVLINVICSATDFNNFFLLRDHKDAQPEFAKLARMMREVMERSSPVEKKVGEWHLPFILDAEQHLDLNEKIKISVARVARVSYNTFDGKVSNPEADKKLFEKLVGADPKHLSPTESVAYVVERGSGEYGTSNFREPWNQFRKLLER